MPSRHSRIYSSKVENRAVRNQRGLALNGGYKIPVVAEAETENTVSQDVARHTFSSLAKVKRTPVDTLQLPPPRSRDIVHQETTTQNMRTSQKNCEIMLQSTSSSGHATAAIFGGSTADGTHLEGSQNQLNTKPSKGLLDDTEYVVDAQCTTVAAGDTRFTVYARGFPLGRFFQITSNRYPHTEVNKPVSSKWYQMTLRVYPASRKSGDMPRALVSNSLPINTPLGTYNEWPDMTKWISRKVGEESTRPVDPTQSTGASPGAWKGKTVKQDWKTETIGSSTVGSEAASKGAVESDLEERSPENSIEETADSTQPTRNPRTSSASSGHSSPENPVGSTSGDTSADQSTTKVNDDAQATEAAQGVVADMINSSDQNATTTQHTSTDHQSQPTTDDDDDAKKTRSSRLATMNAEEHVRFIGALPQNEKLRWLQAMNPEQKRQYSIACYAAASAARDEWERAHPRGNKSAMPKPVPKAAFRKAQDEAASNPPKEGVHFVPEKTLPTNLNAFRPRYAKSAAAINGVPEVKTDGRLTYHSTRHGEVRGLCVDNIRHTDTDAVMRAVRPVPNRKFLLNREDWAVQFQREIESLEIKMFQDKATLRERADHWSLCSLFKAQLLVYHENDITPDESQIRFLFIDRKLTIRKLLEPFTGCKVVDLLWAYRGNGMLTRSKCGYVVFASPADTAEFERKLREGLDGFVEMYGLKSQRIGIKNGETNLARFSNARQRRLELLDLMETFKPAAPAWEPPPKKPGDGHATTSADNDQEESTDSNDFATHAAKWAEDARSLIGKQQPIRSGQARQVPTSGRSAYAPAARMLPTPIPVVSFAPPGQMSFAPPGHMSFAPPGHMSFAPPGHSSPYNYAYAGPSTSASAFGAHYNTPIGLQTTVANASPREAFYTNASRAYAQGPSYNYGGNHYGP